MVGTFERPTVSVTIKPPRGYPSEPFERARTALEQTGVGRAGADSSYYRVRYEEATPDQLRQVTDVLVDLARELVERVEWHELPSPREETFTRNDYNIWLRNAPALGEFLSCYLRGQIARRPNDAVSSVELVPLAGGAQGWKPQFRDGNAGHGVWPSRDNTGEYRLVVTAVGRPR
jgi:hypothetical protein